MKKFLSTFFICLIICGIITFFFAGYILGNIWRLTVVIALFLAILIRVFAYYDGRIEKLEKALEALTGKNQNPDGNPHI